MNHFKAANRRQFIQLILSLLAVSSVPGRISKAFGSVKPSIYDTVIIGGGISGLASAYMLQDKNIMVLEREEAAGGRVCSGEWEGFHYPKGAEYFGKPEDDMADWFSELGIKPVAVPPPTGAIAGKGKIFTGRDILDFLPSDLAEADYERLAEELERLNNQGIEDALYEGALALAKFKQLDRINVKDWLDKGRFHPIIHKLLNVENRGLFGAANQDLSMLFNIPEMAYNLYDPDEFDSSSVYTFPKGMIEIIWAMEKVLGNRLVTGARAEKVSVNQDRTVSIRYSVQGKQHEIKAYTAILATPAPITAAIVENGFSRQVLKTLGAIRYAPYVTINLFLNRRVWSKAWSVSSLDDSFATLYDAVRMQVSAEYDRQSILGVYLPPPDANDKSLLARTDTEILASIIKELDRYFPQIGKSVMGKDIKRFRHAFPVFGVNYLDTINRIHLDETTAGPLFLAGDYMVYATLDGAAASGLNASSRLEQYLS